MANQKQTPQNNSVQDISLQRKFSIPEALQGVVIELGTLSDIRDKRFLLSFDFDGQQAAKEVPDDACVMSNSQMLKAINEPNGMYIETDDLADFAIATVKRLKSRLDYYQAKGDQERLEVIEKAMQSVAVVVQA